MEKEIDLRIKAFPPDLKAQLKSEAALQGITMNAYVVGIPEARAELPGFSRMFPKARK